MLHAYVSPEVDHYTDLLKTFILMSKHEILVFELQVQWQLPVSKYAQY